jgi:hypothetical protein
LKLAIAQDSEMNELLKDVTIPGGGVLPHIETVLRPKPPNKKAVESKDKPKPKAFSVFRANAQASEALDSESDDLQP